MAICCVRTGTISEFLFSNLNIPPIDVALFTILFDLHMTDVEIYKFVAFASILSGGVWWDILGACPSQKILTM
jgi:hypothetical protein